MNIDFDVSQSSSNKTYICCPYCVSRRLDKEFKERADTNFHLMLDVKRNFYYCFRCGVQGKLQDLDSMIGLKLQTEQYQLETIKDRLSNLKIKSVKNFLGFDPSDIGLEINRYSEAFEYLRSRGITEDLIKDYGLLMGKGKFLNRIILPEYNNSRIIYFTARSYKEVYPKYINPPIPKSEIVYNINNVVSDFCILTEGCFSAIAAGKSGIAVLGKKISFSQYSKISLKFKTVFVCLDPDVDKATKEKVRNNFLLSGCNSGIIEGLNGDPNEVSKEVFNEAFLNTKIYKPEQLSLLSFKSKF